MSGIPDRNSRQPLSPAVVPVYTGNAIRELHVRQSKQGGRDER
jgi:hypothetical protein